MGGGGKSSSQQFSTSKQHSESGYPDWYEKMGYDAATEALALRKRPYQAFEGTVVPDFSNMTTATMKMIEDNAGRYQPMYDEAGNVIRQLIARGDIQAGNLEQYMNPYTKQVVDRAVDNAERSGRMAQTGIDVDATKKRAFGNSRQAVQKAVQGAETTRGVGDLTAQLWEKAHDKGVAAQQADWQRQFQNISSQQKLAESQINAAKAAQLGLSADYFNLLSAGKMQEDKDREKKEEVYKKFIEKRDWDWDTLIKFLGALNLTPVKKITDTTGTESTYGSTKQSGGMDFGSILGGGVSLIGMLAGASDRDLKTNIEKLGTDPKTELPVYAYDYKADVKGKKVAGPKRVGYMAQDVEKKYPKAVKKISGKRVIDFTQIPLGA